jgi:hypothetical protein
MYIFFHGIKVNNMLCCYFVNHSHAIIVSMTSSLDDPSLLLYLFHRLLDIQELVQRHLFVS